MFYFQNFPLKQHFKIYKYMKFSIFEAQPRVAFIPNFNDGLSVNVIPLDLSWRKDVNGLISCFSHLRPPGGAHLRADVEVAVDGQNWVAFVPNGHRKQPVAAALQEPFQQKLGRGVQEGLLAIRGANVLRRADRGGVSHFLAEGGEMAVKLGKKRKKPFHEGALFVCLFPPQRDTRTMSFGLTRKSLFPPTGMCFFMRLKELKRHSSSPLLFTRKLKSTSSQLYLHMKRPQLRLGANRAKTRDRSTRSSDWLTGWGRNERSESGPR